MRDAGIIGFVPRGEYSDAETYDFLQFVYYGDSTYVAKKETTGNPPDADNEFWQLLAKGRVFGVSGVKGDKETDYRTGDVNITAANVGALPAENRMVAGDLKVKGGYFPLLNLIRNEYGQSAAIHLTCGGENQKGVLLEGGVSSESAVASTFQIRDRISNLVFLALNRLGNTIRAQGYYPINVKNEAASGVNSGVGILLSTADGNLLNIQAVQKNSEREAVFRISEHSISPYTLLLEISKTSKKIYDSKSGGVKEILVEGDVESICKYKIYSDPEQLGYTWDNFTYMNIPLYTMIYFTIVIANREKAYANDLIPVPMAGVIFAVNAVSRGYILYFDDNNNMYYRMTTKMDEVTAYKPWQRVVNGDDLDELKKSVSDGKALVASAITDKGVSTDATATFQEMADNIRKIGVG